MQESGEMYLETILVLEKERSSLRAIDIVTRMNYSRPSVSRALAHLKEDGCIRVSEEGFVSLTASGRAIAEKIYERHVVLTGALTSLGVDTETARADACRIEHVISDTSFNALKKHIRSMQ